MTHNRRQSRAQKRQQGFSLLETLIAIVVLMIGLLAVLATFAMAIGNTNSVQTRQHRTPESDRSCGKHFHRSPDQSDHIWQDSERRRRHWDIRDRI